jgi:hypothetical protein
MRSRDKDEIGRLFAQLTGQLEDACELAVACQDRRLALSARARLTIRLRRQVARLASVLDLTDSAIARARKSGGS